MKFLRIHSKVMDTGVEILFRKRPYPITYPSFVWGVTPKETQIALKDNLALVTTMHLPLVFNSLGAVYYSGRPLLEPYFVQNFFKDISSCTEVDGTSTDEVVRKFFNTDYQFLDPVVGYPSQELVDSPFCALVGTSFGKDSLLTYAVADEIGARALVFNRADGLRGDSRESHVPAILEMLGNPYVGSKVLTTAICLNKAWTKKVLLYQGISTPKFYVCKSDQEAERIRGGFPYARAHK